MLRLFRPSLILLILLAAMEAHPARAESAFLVADISAGLPSGSTGTMVLTPFLSVNGRALFLAREHSSGLELWASDGTIAGTDLLRETCPGPSQTSCHLSLLGAVGRTAIFAVVKNIPGSRQPLEIWRTDGTRAGTFAIAGQDGNGPFACSSSVGRTAGSVVYFPGWTPLHGCELWRTDGTAAGTFLVKDLVPGDSDGWPNVLGAAAERLYLFTRPTSGTDLWVSDGTAAGTVRLRTFAGMILSSLVTGVGSRLFFVGDGQLWTSDGTAAGTRPITRFPSAVQMRPNLLKEIDGFVYFLVNDVIGGTDLWRSDGTEAGTRRVTAFGHAEPFNFYTFDSSQLHKAGQFLIFVADDGLTGQRLWASRGSPETTAPIPCPGTCPRFWPVGSVPLVPLGGRVLFPATDSDRGLELWSTDGAGYTLVRDVCPGRCDSHPVIAPALGKIWFMAHNEDGYELWVTNGTPAGTTHVADLGQYPPGEPFLPVAVGDKVFFPATEYSDRTQLWVTDGTREGTQPVTWIDHSGPSSYPSGLANFAGEVLFSSCERESMGVWKSSGTATTTIQLASISLSSPCRGPAARGKPVVHGGLTFFLVEEGIRTSQLWRTDGTAAGTFRLTADPELNVSAGPVVLGARVVFVLAGSEEGLSFWESDGSLAGTRKLFDLPDDVSGPWDLTVLGSELYFTAGRDRVPTATDLWVTDGTAAGTRQITEFERPYIFDDHPPQPTRIGGVLFFVAEGAFGPELWKTDGTPGGTTPMLSDPEAGGRNLSDLVVYHGALYFIARLYPASQNDKRLALWRSDGTEAGTALVKLFGPRDGLLPESAGFTVLGDRLFFAVNDGEHGTELWRSDGTAAGTVLVRDLAPGRASSYPRQLALIGGRLFFSANDGVHGFELWESDGTEIGTRLVHDIAPGGPSSDPQELTEAGDHLFFRADDGLHGSELWALPLVALPGCQPSQEILCLGGGRFRVEADWRDFQLHSGQGHAVPLTADTGYFWFFDSANVEVILKVLDGRSLNGHHWVFYGALSNVEYALTVTDTWTGAVRRYVNPPGRLGSVGDTNAFGPLGATGSGLTFGPAAVAYEPIVRMRTAAVSPCAPSATRLCLQDGRFAVEARWKDFQGKTGQGEAVPLAGGDTGYFWFFGPDNVEVVLKVLDGRPLNNKFWIFYGALSNVEYTLTVTDTETGKVRTYTNPSGKLASVADTGAF